MTSHSRVPTAVLLDSRATYLETKCIVRCELMQHQSARFLGPPRERSPDHLTNACQINANNNNVNHRTCISCTDTCEHNLKPGHVIGGGGGGHLGPGHLYPDSCHSYDSAPDRLIADRPNYYTDLNRSDCSDAGSGVLNSCIQLKSEPPGGPSSPESSTELPPSGLDECAGCDMPIQVGWKCSPY
ncbi:AAEL008689-PA [Aedes aegypti]|uniref:AAEL008689-PA n=1 Tax=Aedes aegypti TaxID=7159 RepID=Q16Y20_AEDAE|nr:AAEL008689-PA [Aedes aegypti]